MRWAWGTPDARLPSWAARIAYGERFGLEPHRVNPPVLWWYRVNELDTIRAARDARKFVDKHTKAKAEPDTQKLYDWLVQQSRNG